MANTKTLVDQWSVKDLEDGSSLNIMVESCTEMGNESKPGIQVHYLGYIVNYEPVAAEMWAYQAKKAGTTTYYLEKYSWAVHTDQFVKLYLILGNPAKAKVEVKTRSSQPVIKDYNLPFNA